MFSSFFYHFIRIKRSLEKVNRPLTQWVKTVMQIKLKVKLNAEKYSFAITRKKAKSVIYFHERE